jgi:hypothetical protein
MGRIRVYSALANLKDAEFFRFASAFVSDITTQFNGNLQFVENLRAAGVYRIEISNSSEVLKVSHSLGRVPTGFLVVRAFGAQVIYSADEDSYPWTTSELYLMAGGSVTADIYVI